MKVSIITVCYNSERYISTAIESVLSQEYQNLEYIIIDGGSSDKTISIIQSYGGKISKLISEPDKGIYDAMNKGLKIASGDLIGILNSDDFFLSEEIVKNVVAAFKKKPEAQLVLGNVDFVHPDSLSRVVRFYSSLDFKPWKMRFGFMPAHPATFVKRSVYEKVGGYKLGYKIGADFEWFVRAFIVHKLHYFKVNQTFVRMRLGGVSTSGFKSYWVSSKEQVRALRENSVYSNLCFVFIRLPIKYVQKKLAKFI